MYSLKNKLLLFIVFIINFFELLVYILLRDLCCDLNVIVVFLHM